MTANHFLSTILLAWPACWAQRHNEYSFLLLLFSMTYLLLLDELTYDLNWSHWEISRVSVGERKRSRAAAKIWQIFIFDYENLNVYIFYNWSAVTGQQSKSAWCGPGSWKFRQWTIKWAILGLIFFPMKMIPIRQVHRNVLKWSHTGVILVLDVGKKKKEKNVKDLEIFWKYLDAILNSGKPGSNLFQIARLHHLVQKAIFPADWTNDDMLVSSENVWN